MMQLIAHITTAVILLTPVLSSGQCMTYPVPFAQRIQNSNLVIEGRVISQNAFWNTSGDFIYTSSIVEVNKLFKGTISTNQIEVITEGGIIGNMMIKAEPALQLKVDQIGVFMGVSSAIAGSTSNLPLTSKFEGVAANQSFVTYDPKTYTAADPFNNYQDITTEIYQFIPTVTGIPYVELIPFNLYPSQNLGPGINTQMVPPIISAITSPSTAGTFTTITITGNNFGAGPFGGSRALEFRDANNGGAGFIPTPANHIISWSNTSIQAWVPTQAGSGNIRVTNDLGESTVSGVTTTIDYNQTNVVSGGLYYQPDLINDNGAGGYTFQYNTTFSANAGAVAAFERALQTWRCGTFVNFNKSGTTAVACQALDNINLVTFDGSCSLPSGVLGVSYSYYSGCGGGVWYLNENDLKFRTNGTNGINWNFGPAATAGGLFDFESVAVHELGHSHQLGHTISPITVMHYAIGPNTDRRTLTASSETAGGTNIMTRSVNTNSCGPTAMASLNAGSCAINAPIANFTGNPTTGCNSLNVTFTDASIGSPTSWSWSFPGGVPNSFSGQTPPAINYAAPGTYSVTLTVTNAFGSDSETKNNFISVNNCPPPVADFLANPTTACVGQTINFTDISINNPTSWSWSFPGGTPNASTFTNPAVTYATPGTYDVTMTATNAYGSNTITKSSFITVTTCPSPPAPSFTATQTTICAGGQVTFTDQSTNNPTSWQWTFTGGSPTTSIAQNPTVTYPSAGTYPVSLVATNSAGSNSITVTGYVTVNVCSPPVVDFAGWPTTICQGTSVSFTDLSTNSPTSWSWTFPGGTPAAVTTSSASITYNIVGTYNVTLQATNAFGTGALTKNTYITVNSCPPAGTGLIVNDGSLIHVEAGALVTVQGGIINQDNTISNIGSIDNWGLITLTGDWTNNSSSTALINASPGTVDLLGSSQNISGSGITNFYNLNLSGTGIKFMNVNSRVLGTLALNDRELNTQSYWMHVINPDPNAITRTGTLSGTPVQGFVSSTGAGRLKRNTNSTLGYLFPVGSSQGSTPRFRPVELTPTSSDPHTLASRFVNNDPSADGLSVLQKDATIGFVNSQWYQKINRESGLSNIDVRLYFESTADNIVPLPTLLMTQWSALAPIQWNPINSVAVTGVTSPGLSNTMRAGWTTFDTENFNLAPQSIPLPIELVDLTAKAAGDRILVDWITATEINNDGFELMRKFGLNDFVPIHWVDGQGTTNQTTTYQFIDRDVISGVTYYYRLKQYDFDGTTSLSEVVSAKITGNGASISAWPNPFAQTTQIVINLPLEEDVELLIVNSIGQVVSVLHKGLLASGLHAFEFNTNTTGCSSGIYVAEVRMNGAVERIKIMSSD